MRGRPPSGSHWAPEEAKLRIYHGAVDQSALTSRSPKDVFNEVMKTLQSMGIDVKSEGDYKVKCTRRKRKSRNGRVVSPSTNASVDTFDGDSGMSLSMADQKKRRGVAGTATFRNLLRRSSAYSHESIPPPHQRHTSGSDDDGVAPSNVTEQRHASKQCTSSSLNSTSTVSGKPVAPIYGDESIDSGDEIRFSVELCKFKNLHGLYIVDIRRMRGNVWGYKFVYHQLLEALDLYRKGGYIPGPERKQTPTSNPIMATDSKKNTDFNGLGSIAEIKV
jgi:Kinase associated domain 1